MVAQNEISRGERHVDVVLLPRSTPPREVEVLVVGGGPTGLATALDLHRHHVDVAVVDAATSFRLERAGAMGHSARTVEFFQQWGVADRVRRGWTFPPEWNLGTQLRTSLAGHDLRAVQRPPFDTRPVHPYSFASSIRRPQTALQQAFLDQLADIDVVVAGGWRLVALEQDSDGATSTLEHTELGARRVVRSKYVVGADGARSAVRQLTGIEREGAYATERHFRFVVRTVGDYGGRDPFPSGTNVIVNDVHSGFLAALDENSWRVYAGPFPLDHVPTTEELLRLARAAFGSPVELELLDATPYFKSTRLAREFRRGRALLVGDAAHVRTPGGNLGEGFGDVFNLGWKLAAVLRQTGGDALLDSYDRERRPHNRRVGAAAKRRADDSERNVAEARALGFPADDDLTPEAEERRRVIGGILARGAGPDWGVQFDERYDDSPAVWYEPEQRETEEPWDASVFEPGGRPGHRAPNGVTDPYGGTLYDRIRSDVALLVLSDDVAAVAAFEAAAVQRAIDLEVVHLDDPSARALYGAPFALVRPDHHVGWRGTATALDADAILDVVYGRGSAPIVGPAATPAHTVEPARETIAAAR
ncbi:FAD-dependent monooxygenase [Microbacterium sp. CFBP9034]|uniref:FAD-dependent monooxygenase n=1 Tax=Microbacterium sp. CFBP9034 TaxID=3096540 RepID=UPI002A6B66DD|nr:FAD-dependent monooxygenase [Microbacterium sp. CFBP9034]MDY0910207.1 FAD-dependent oxidoreductase [Microbacterium sp. CFBP9034]